jgi:23S rRNA (cytosine1962-C5)-methyltransferase
LARSPILTTELKNWLIDRWPPTGPQARRLFHGRGRTFAGLEHLTIDWYPPLLLVTSHQPLASEQLDELLTTLDRAAPGRVETVILQQRLQPSPRLEVLRGSLPDRPVAREAGLVYPLLLNQGVNHGFFLDMAGGRQWLRQYSRGKKVLNLFAYTCSLSVAALAGDAAQVVNLDMSKTALAVGRTAHQLNRLDDRRASFLAHDLFKSFGKLEQLGPFDLVVIDPPADQGRSFRADKDWPRILRRLPKLATAGADILACVSAPELGSNFLKRQFTEQLPEADLHAQLNAGEDFPENDPDKGWHLLNFRMR